MTIATAIASRSQDMGRWLAALAARHPGKIALAVGDESLTYAQMHERSRGLARALLAEGIRPGDRVGLHWANSADAALLLLACFQAGIIALPINIRFKAGEIAYVMSHAGAVAWFSQPHLTDMARAAAATLATPLPIRTSLPEERSEGALPALDAAAPSVIMYTSGTTARPKGVIHSHASLLAGAEAMETFGLDGDQIMLGTTSMMHVSGLVCTLLGAMQAGGTAVMMGAFDAAGALEAIERHGCTWMAALPAMMQFILDEQERQPRDMSSLRVAFSGGDTVPLPLQARMARHFPNAAVLELYGITELCPVSCNTKDAIRPGSMGRTSFNVAARVLDADGHDVPDGAVGEFALSSPSAFSGYWRDEAATRAAMRDGWFLTGDLGHRDADGYLWFNGRKKEIIIRGGSNIAPQEVEEALYKHPAVREAGVIGMPHPVFGEEVVACIALRDGQRASEDELCAFARTHLADYKVPTRIVFQDILPKGITGKIQRRALKEMLAT